MTTLTDAAGATDRDLSGYLLEFSVMPGGARQGDVHAHSDLDSLRVAVERHYQLGDVSGSGQDGSDDLAYLVMWYRAVLHLWVVRRGVVTEGIDLRTYLRTGDERCDRTLARVLAMQDDADDDWSDVQDLMSEYAERTASSLPLLTRLFELRDRVAAGDADAPAELERLEDAVYDGETPDVWDGMSVTRLSLDWDAIAGATPPVPEPSVTTGWLAVRWPDTGRLHDESHLMYYRAAQALHTGWNDLECGGDEHAAERSRRSNDLVSPG